MTAPTDPVALPPENASAASEQAPSGPPANNVPAVGIRGILQRVWYAPVLVAYAAMVAYAAVHHEAWLDEAQAWLVARDCDLGLLFSEALRYEGHPALWYLIVKLAILLGLPYEGFSLLSGAIATLGVWLLLAKSPFPKWLAALLPFTFFLGFQFAVVARSYALLPLLLFAVAVLYRDRWEKPIRWAAVLLLLANVSSHSFLIACGIMFIYLVDCLFRWLRVDARARRLHIAAVALYVIGALGVVVMLWPASDCTTPTGVNGQIIFTHVFDATFAAVDSAFFGFSALTIGMLLVSGYWFWKTGVFPLFLACFLPVLAVFVLLRVNSHHHGIVFVTWLYVFWCSMDACLELRRRGAANRRLRRMSYVMCFVVAALVIRQGYWTYSSVALDVARPYCGAKALASEIKARGLTKYRLAIAREWAVTVQPYFSKNIFVNFPNPRGLAYIDWHASCSPDLIGCSAEECLEEPCDILVWAEKGKRLPTIWTVPKLASAMPPNWRYVGYFSGQTIFKDRLACPTGFGLFAVQRVADELGMPTAEYDASVSKRQRAEVVFLPDAFAVNLGQFHLDFGNLLRKLEPAAAIRQFQYVISVASAVSEECFPSGLLSCLQYTVASAHCGLAAALASSDPKAAMKHVQTALMLIPSESDAHVDKAVTLAQGGRLEESVAELRQALRIARMRLLEDLSQGIAEKKENGNRKRRKSAS